uniref:Uncharacterized protein n=1 Tax=Arundo donax TaxID=35708 RepID=A0A0A9A7U8_ARUDO
MTSRIKPPFFQRPLQYIITQQIQLWKKCVFYRRRIQVWPLPHEQNIRKNNHSSTRLRGHASYCTSQV